MSNQRHELALVFLEEKLKRLKTILEKVPRWPAQYVSYRYKDRTPQDIIALYKASIAELEESISILKKDQHL